MLKRFLRNWKKTAACSGNEWETVKEDLLPLVQKPRRAARSLRVCALMGLTVSRANMEGGRDQTVLPQCFYFTGKSTGRTTSCKILYLGRWNICYKWSFTALREIQHTHRICSLSSVHPVLELVGFFRFLLLRCQHRHFEVLCREQGNSLTPTLRIWGI